MERFRDNEIFNELELFGDFANNAKSTIEGIIEDLSETINKYNESIKNTEAEIAENEEAREKCKNEIVKMKENIKQINESIENVQKTYKNIVDAYSKTSMGDTKDLYSEIIETARINCEDEVEKCDREITRLEDDIEAINNNIADFTNLISQLHSNLDKQRIELSKFTKGLDYMKSSFQNTKRDLDNITNRKDIIKHITRETSSLTSPKPPKEKPKKAEKEKAKEEPKEEKIKEEVKEEPTKGNYKNTFEDSLKQIYDLTGYNKKEEKKESVEENSHLEEVFKEPSQKEEVKEDNSSNVFENSSELSEWEKMLNSSYEEPKKDNKEDDKVNVLNDLLKPYGTSFEKLKGYTSDKIEYKSGRSLPFDMTPEDLTKAVNAISSIDLKQMKTVGPEITLLRKVKLMKEGSL